MAKISAKKNQLNSVVQKKNAAQNAGPPISVCIIGMNEEKKVEDCLKSVQQIASEIVFIDSGSTDKTLQIVKKYKARIFYKKFNNYIEQKNYALEKAKNNWVLSLDCDERLSEESQNWILNEFPSQIQQNSAIKAFEFSRLTFYIFQFIQHSGWYPDKKIRLFAKDTCHWAGSLIHETVDVHGAVVKPAAGDIIHYSFDSITDHLKTIDKFSELAAREAFAKGRTSGPFTIIGRSLWVGIRKMVFELAWLDGVAGLILTGLSMTATWCKYSRLYILQREAKEVIRRGQ